jgi:hypothetical protein
VIDCDSREHAEQRAIRLADVAWNGINLVGCTASMAKDRKSSARTSGNNRRQSLPDIVADTAGGMFVSDRAGQIRPLNSMPLKKTAMARAETWPCLVSLANAAGHRIRYTQGMVDAELEFQFYIDTFAGDRGSVFLVTARLAIDCGIDGDIPAR